MKRLSREGKSTGVSVPGPRVFMRMRLKYPSEDNLSPIRLNCGAAFGQFIERDQTRGNKRQRRLRAPVAALPIPPSIAEGPHAHFERRAVR